MNASLQNVVRSLRRLVLFPIAFIPRGLPIGMTAFDSWASSIILLSGLPDNDSMRFTLATMVMHLPPQAGLKAPMYFVLSLRKAAANQVAAGVFHEIKERQLAAQKAAEVTAAQTNPEVTPTQGASDGRAV